jgi:hypothetical protein
MGALEEYTVPDGEEQVVPDEEEQTVPDGFVKSALVAASLGAGGIHIWAAWAHSSITRVLIFFTVVATVQLWLAAAVIWVRSIPWSVLIGGAVVNLGVAVVWVLSRTTGVPLQPESMASMDTIMNRALDDPGVNTGAMAHQESFGLLDTASSLLEVVVVVAVLVLWMNRRRQDVEPGTDEIAAPGAGGSEDPAATVSPDVR